jgi:hypothetical protein
MLGDTGTSDSRATGTKTAPLDGIAREAAVVRMDLGT